MSGGDDLLERCGFPSAGTAVDLAVSGGADSVGLALLAHGAGLTAHLHHVDHHVRATSADDARLVADLARRLGWDVTVHEVALSAGPNFEGRARAARRAVLPVGALTGHTMDDVAESVVINLVRGAGTDGLSPMVGDCTKPLVRLRRAEVLDVVRSRHEPFVVDETNADVRILRNRVRHETLAHLNDLAARDLVPVLFRQAELMGEERRWLDELVADDRALGDVDCRELALWETARLRRWLRMRLRSDDEGDGCHPPSADEIERVLEVVRGDVVATQLSGARRVARSAQRLRLEK